jgi:hypothetical protein
MPTFRELYCIVHRCEPSEFVRKVFCSCFSTDALLPPALCAVLPAYFFRAERELIATLGDATSLAKFKEDLHYFTNRRYLSWWRRKAGIRVSIRRLGEVAKACFEMGTPEHNAKRTTA